MSSGPTFGNSLRHFAALAGLPDNLEISDGSLLQHFVARRDEYAFAGLLKRHGPMVFGVARRVLGHVQDTEDVFQASFLLLARKAGSIRKNESVGSWLHTVAYHLAIKISARRRLRKDTEQKAAIMRALRAEETVLGDLENAIDDALQKLPEHYRQALVLCCLEDKSHAEAAKILGCPLATLRSRLARARKRLHAILNSKEVNISTGALAGLSVRNAADAGTIARLLRSTLQASLRFASGQTSTVLVSPAVSALVSSGMRAILVNNAKLLIPVLLCMSLLASSAGGMWAWLATEESLANASPQRGAEAEPVQGARPEHVDVYGDPLPEGVIKRLGSVRFRHGNHIESVAYSPDGKWIATGADDATVRIWDRATGKQLLRFDGHSDDVHFLAFTPDGKYIISSSGLSAGGRDHKSPCTLKWEAATGKVVLRFPANRWNREMTALALSSDGRRLAACLTPQLCIYDVGTGLLLHDYPFEDGIVYKLRFTPDNRKLAVTADGLGVVLLDVDTGQVIWRNSDQKGDPQTYEPHRQGLAFSPDGKRIAVSMMWNQPGRVLDALTGQEIFQIPNACGPLTYSRDGKVLYCRSGFYDATNGKKMGELNPPPNWIYDWATSPDGRIVTLAGSRVLQFWDARTGQGTNEALPGLGDVHQIHLSSDGLSIITSSRFPEASTRKWDLATCKQKALLPGYEFAHVDVAAAGDRLAFCSPNTGKITLKHSSTLQDEFTLAPTQESVRTLSITHDGKKVIATASHGITDGGPVLRWEVKPGDTARELNRLPGGGGARVAAISPDDHIFAAGGWDGIIRLYDIEDGKELRQLVGQEAEICGLCFSPDGKFVTAVTGIPMPNKAQYFCRRRDPRMRIWEVATGKVIKTIDGTADGGWTVAWSPDGKSIAAGGDDGKVRIWDVATGTLRSSLSGHTGAIMSLAYTSDGKQLLSGSTDTTVLVWDLTSVRKQAPNK
jgi:RNA polymerase sigma factor (sigma-70 family)